MSHENASEESVKEKESNHDFKSMDHFADDREL